VPEIEGVNHIALTVTDIGASVEWYTKVLEAQVLMEQSEETFDRVALLVPPLIIGMTKHKGATASDDRFSETRVGLDHVSFGVPNRAALDEWAARLDELDIPHGPIRDVEYGSTLVIRDPDNIQLEFFSLPG
jgi:catechol 2,3-dioxygenase-like lactoylglutathione lyase family enzyme